MTKLILQSIERSPLNTRRMMLLLLKTQGQGRRAFTEGCRYAKIASSSRRKRYEIPSQKEIPTNA